MTFTFDNSIPAANNNPSTDQPSMLINNQSTESIIAVDHVSFNETNGGYHKQVRLLNETIPATIASSSTIFSKTFAGEESALVYSPDDSTDEYRLTRTKTADYTTFANNTTYTGALVGGWTFLPGNVTDGGMLMQYGLAAVSAKGTATTITFPIAFSIAPYSITIGSVTGEGNSPGENNQFVKDGSVTTTTFQIVNSSSSSARKVYWQAVGV